MKYFCVDEETAKYVEVDETTNQVKVFLRSDLEKQVSDAKARLAVIPEPADDNTLLEWARTHYPQVNYETERQALQALIATNEAILESI